MALAVLGSRNELHPTDAMPYMRNPLAEFSNPNPNPRHAHPPSAAAAAKTKPAASEDSFFGGVDYVVYNLGTYSRGERRDLRRRLSLELEQVRSLSVRIDSAAAGSGRSAAAVVSLDSPNARTPAGRGSKASIPPAAAGLNGKKAAPASAAMKRCGQILNRLRQHKDAWIFLDPVDAEKWSLHDYHQIIHNPMDLGTVKRKLDAREYASPENFAADVRLTFTNALTYNPQGHDVYNWAALLLASFDKSFNAQFPGAAAGNLTTTTPAGVVAKSKLPKPKAKAPNKREMSFEEKQQLGEDLTSLPPEKAEQLLQILNRRNKSDASQHLGNEVELDIEMLDTETLWELDRFVSNCKKSMSKLKRALPENPSRITPAIPLPAMVAEEEDDEVHPAKKARKDGELVEEDIDILGDDGPATVFPPVVIEKDAKSDRSSSSGSGSSSSSGSRSGSSSTSSGSGSDSDEAESPFPGRRTSPGGS